MAFGTPIFGLFEHKIGIFVRFGGAMAGSNVSNWSNGNNRSNRNDGRDSLGC